MARRTKNRNRSIQGTFESEFKPEYCKQLIDHMKEGNSFASFCVEIGIARQSGYRWVQTHDDFYEAKRIADAAYEVWWERAGKLGMMGKIKGFNASSWIFRMKNSFNYSDKQEVVMNNEKSKVDNMTDQELKDYAIGLLKRESSND